MAARQEKRLALGERDTKARREIEAAAKAAAQVDAIQADIDGRVAAAKYADQPYPDVTAQHRALAEAKDNHQRLAANARAAAHLRGLLASDMAALHGEIVELNKLTDRLVHAALVERMASYAPALADAERRLCAVHRQAFVAALAADRIAMAKQYGEFYGSALFAELHISKPMHPSYFPVVVPPDTAQAQRVADYRAMEKEADQLLHSLLTIESGNQ
jgi:hypothetical protein